MCLHFGTFRFCFFGWIPKEGDSPSWPEESKETGGFVAGNPTGTASPWHTTLLAKSSVLYLCEGAGSGRLVLPERMGQKKTGAGWNCRAITAEGGSLGQHRSKGIPFPLHISAPPISDLHRIRAWYHFDIKCWYHCDTNSGECGSFTAWYRLSASSVLPDRTVL